MKVPPQAVHSTICACFYAELLVGQGLHSTGSEALAWWRLPLPRQAEPAPHERIYDKLTADLATLAPGEFEAGWDHLLRVHRAAPEGLRQMLDARFGAAVLSGLAARGKSVAEG